MRSTSRSSPKASKQKRRRGCCATSRAIRCRDFSSTACCRATVLKRCCLGHKRRQNHEKRSPRPRLCRGRTSLLCVEAHFAQKRAPVLRTDVVRDEFHEFLLAFRSLRCLLRDDAADRAEIHEKPLG